VGKQVVPHPERHILRDHPCRFQTQTPKNKRPRQRALLASTVQPGGPMQPLDDTSDAHSFELKLRIAADPACGAYQVSIELADVNVVVEAIDVDLRRAVRTAADRCAEGLRELGYAVTPAEVIAALEEALENSELVQKSAQPAN